MMQPVFLPVATAFAMVVLSACGRGYDESGEEVPTPVFGAEERRGSVDLQPLTPDDLAEAELGGDLGCLFSSSVTDGPLLAVRARVDTPGNTPSFAARLAGAIVTGKAGRAGGYASLADGGRFSGNGVLLEVAVTGDREPESIPAASRPAAMRASRPDGSRQIFQGFWICGV